MNDIANGLKEIIGSARRYIKLINKVFLTIVYSHFSNLARHLAEIFGKAYFVGTNAYISDMLR